MLLSAVAIGGGMLGVVKADTVWKLRVSTFES